MPRNALGKGLSALIREPEPPPPPAPEAVAQAAAAQGAGAAAAPALAPREGLLQVDIDLIDPSPYQPRTRFNETALDELAQSIRASGIVQPLVARLIARRYQLIAGERRWRAAQRAGLNRVPVVLKEVPEELALEMTLIENLQREDLNPIEEAQAFQRLMDEFALTQEQVAERTGKERTTIANSLRLLRLEEPIQGLIEENRLTAGHARALLTVSDPNERIEFARKVARNGMTVRQVERMVVRSARPRSAPASTQVDPNTKAALEDLQRHYATRVHIRAAAAGRPGEVSFEYYDNGDLMRLYQSLMR
jgi:ParB family transcriptional regulator, chromosome partitioning protein